MRKFYLISLLATVAMAYGCGYGDGKDVESTGTDKTSPLPQLSASCKSNMECKIGTNIVGDCIAGVCRRFCSETNDCERGTVF